MTVRALEFYCGIGGLHLALSRSSVDAEIVQSFDWNQSACKVYSANFPNAVRKVDISTLTASSLSPLNASLWLLSPSCQPYTVLNPNARGEQDPRSRSFLHLVENVLPELAISNDHPRYLLVENVAGFEDSSTRQILVSTLRSLNYATLELLITPLQFGIPNSRLRYYLLAKMMPLKFKNVAPTESDRVWHQIPGDGAWLDPRLSSSSEPSNRSPIQDMNVYLDDSQGEDVERYWVPDKVLEKWGRLFDIVKPSSQRTCCFTRGYTQLVERAGSILQENGDADTSTTFNKFYEAKAERLPDAIAILQSLRLRYFSPSELLRIFAFNPPLSESTQPLFMWPDAISRKTKYKLIGNSINVKVVQELINYLFQEPE